jgi:hypothetical protein
VESSQGKAAQMKISDAQFGALSTLREFGSINAVEVRVPDDMNGKFKVKLECHVMNVATMRKLEAAKLVAVSRGATYQLTDATGLRGHARRNVCISITADGLGYL